MGDREKRNSVGIYLFMYVHIYKKKIIKIQIKRDTPKNPHLSIPHPVYVTTRPQTYHNPLYYIALQQKTHMRFPGVFPAFWTLLHVASQEPGQWRIPIPRIMLQSLQMMRVSDTLQRSVDSCVTHCINWHIQIPCQS